MGVATTAREAERIRTLLVEVTRSYQSLLDELDRRIERGVTDLSDITGAAHELAIVIAFERRELIRRGLTDDEMAPLAAPMLLMVDDLLMLSALAIPAGVRNLSLTEPARIMQLVVPAPLAAAVA